MKNITAALALLAPIWTQIADISGVPGVSVGAFYEGEVVLRHSIGYRDLEEKLPSTSDTIFPIGSLSKAFTAAIYGGLVDEGFLDWESAIRENLPDFRSTSPQVEQNANAIDLLSHRTGIIGGETFYFHDQPLLIDSSLTATFGGLPSVYPFRSTMQYNNLGYSLTSKLMSLKTHMNYGDLLETYITKPLGMNRTGVEADRKTAPNTAKLYMVSEDGTAVRNARPLYFENSQMIASGGIWSSIDDLLVFYQEVLNAASQQLRGNTSAEKNQSPLKQLKTLLTGHTFFPSQRRSLNEQTYGLGWIRTQLPGELGAIGLNPGLVKNMPIVGRSSPSRLTIYHQGNVPGATSAVYLFPDSSSGVVVLANAYGLSDVPDWIAQSIIDVLFEEDTDTPYVQLAHEAVFSYQKWCAKTVNDLAALQRPNSAPAALDGFSGVYENGAKTFKLLVIFEDGKLKLQFQGLPEEEFDLNHSHDDVFSWFISPRGQNERGRNIFAASHYLVRFQRDSITRKVTGLRWAHDGSENGELFERRPALRLFASSVSTLSENLDTKALSISLSVIIMSELRLKWQANQSQALTILSRSIQSIATSVVLYSLIY
ncbi:hypothetical protein AWENTII_003170 [Aspergillus wentii]|nr:ornithine carbamoyltransferase [Aspergillus wentii]